MRKLSIRVFALWCLAVSAILCPQPRMHPAGASPPSGYVQVWADEFSGAALDTANNWNYYQPWYHAIDADSVGGGVLTIKTYTDSVGVHHAGMISSENKYMPRYGYLEARIDFDGASGMWSSFYLQSQTNDVAHIGSPHEGGTEFDIIEHEVHDFWDNDVSAQAPSSLHWDSYGETGRSCGGDFHAGNDTSLATGYHVYGLEWTPTAQKVYFDGNLVWTVADTTGDPYSWGCPTSSACGRPQSPSVPGPVSHTNEYIFLASELDLTCWEPPGVTTCGYSHGTPPSSYGSLASTSVRMKVDYVRAYQLVPSAPSSLIAAGASTSQINLSWTDNSYNEDGFKIERSTDGSSFSQVGTAAADATTYSDTGLSRNTKYYYRVRGYDAAGNGSYSNTANGYTDVVAPSAVSNLSISMQGKLSLAVSWTAPGDDGTGEKCTAYDLRRSTSTITSGNFASATQITTSAPHAAGYAECKVATSLTACTTYYFAIKTKDEAGNWSVISNVPNGTTLCTQNIVAECGDPDDDITAPADVSDLAISDHGKLTMAVSWTAPGDDGSTGTASEYDIRYSTSTISSGNFSSATRAWIGAPDAAGTTECHVFQGLTACTRYYFAIKTKDENGNWSAISNVPNDTTRCLQNIVAECDGLGLSQRQAPKEESAARVFLAPTPNPARVSTSFQISVPGEVANARLRVGVYDIAGRRVRALIDRVARPGPAQVQWNLLDDSGRRVAPSMYMVRVDVADTRRVFPLVVIR